MAEDANSIPPAEAIHTPLMDPEEEAQIEKKAKSFLKFHRRLVLIGSVIALMAICTAPMWCRLVATAAEVGVPYLQYRNDPTNRGQIVDGVQRSMDYWPEDAQEIFIPLFDRLDEGREIGTRFIGELIAASYGFEADSKIVLNEWQLIDEANSLMESLGPEYQEHADAISLEIEVYQLLVDPVVPFADRLALLPAIEDIPTFFPNLEALMINQSFKELLFVHINARAFPQFNLDQLRSIFQYGDYSFSATNLAQSAKIAEIVAIQESGVFPNKTFERYWPIFSVFVLDDIELYFKIYRDFSGPNSEKIAAALDQYAITDPAMIWTVADRDDRVFKFVLNGFESSDYYENAYGISPDDLSVAMDQIAGFQAGPGSFTDQQTEAKVFLRSIFDDLFATVPEPDGNGTPPSESDIPEADTAPLGLSPAETVIDNYSSFFIEEPLDDTYLPIAEAAIKLSPSEPDLMFRAFVSVMNGRSRVILDLGETETDLTWSLAEAIAFYTDLFSWFPDLSHRTLIDGSQYLIWTQIRNGNRNFDSVRHTTAVGLMAIKETLGEIGRIEDGVIANKVVVDLLEPMYMHNVLVDPYELANQVDGFTPIEAESFYGVFGEVNVATLALTPEVFYRHNDLETGKIAVVIAWSYFLPEGEASDGGIINPAVQVSGTGALEHVSSSIGEGDLNQTENAAKKMMAFTSNGEVVEQPWSNFGSTDKEIRTNLATAGVVAAFTPNYLYDITLEVPLANMGMLNDHLNTFLVVYENDQGDEKVYVFVLRPQGSFDEQEILDQANELAAEGFRVRSIAWGDPGYGVYYGTDDTGASRDTVSDIAGATTAHENGVLVGLQERETHRLTFSLK